MSIEKINKLWKLRTKFKYRVSGFYIIAAVCLRKPSQSTTFNCLPVELYCFLNGLTSLMNYLAECLWHDRDIISQVLSFFQCIKSKFINIKKRSCFLENNILKYICF